MAMVLTAPTLCLTLRLRGFVWQREHDFFSELCSMRALWCREQTSVTRQAAFCDELQLDSRSISTLRQLSSQQVPGGAQTCI